MKVLKIPCEQIVVDHENNISRDRVNPSECQELAASIQVHGLQQPVIVKDLKDGTYQLVAGFRRFTAVNVILGMDEIDAVITEAENLSEINLIENLQRKDLSYWEECCAVRQAFPPETSLTHIVSTLSKSRNWVRARWNVWKLPPEVLDKVESGELGYSEVIALTQDHGNVVASAEKIIMGKAAGKTKGEAIAKSRNTAHLRNRKTVQRAMSTCLEMGRMEAVQALRYALSEIDDEEFFDWFDQNP